MHVSLTPHLEELVRDKVKSGLYSSSSEVVMPRRAGCASAGLPLVARLAASSSSRAGSMPSAIAVRR